MARITETDQKTAAQVTQGDQLDQDIRGILRKFDAGTYAIPPIFRERLQYHIDQLTHSGNLKLMYARKQRYWPTITKEFDALGLPEEMAYTAYAESQFDPNAESDAGAKGMWQMTATTAQALGLVVNDQVDERLNVARQTHAAARHIANLLAEFGEDSFMLAMASYNRGEARRPAGAAPGGGRAGRLQEGEAGLLAPLPAQEAAGGDPGVRAQDPGRGHRVRESGPVRAWTP